MSDLGAGEVHGSKGTCGRLQPPTFHMPFYIGDVMTGMNIAKKLMMKKLRTAYESR
jgi:hypothetical protein